MLRTEAVFPPFKLYSVRILPSKVYSIPELLVHCSCIASHLQALFGAPKDSDLANSCCVGTISGGNKPCVIVSCKCDNPPRARQIQVGMVEELGQSCGGIETYQTSANVPESQKRCISVLLRAILAKRSGKSNITQLPLQVISLFMSLVIWFVGGLRSFFRAVDTSGCSFVMLASCPTTPVP